MPTTIEKDGGGTNQVHQITMNLDMPLKVLSLPKLMPLGICATPRGHKNRVRSWVFGPHGPHTNRVGVPIGEVEPIVLLRGVCLAPSCLVPSSGDTSNTWTDHNRWGNKFMNMRYHIYKATRTYTGTPYVGPTSDGDPAQAEQLCDAVRLRDVMNSRNPVGWIIHDTVTHQDIFPD